MTPPLKACVAALFGIFLLLTACEPTSDVDHFAIAKAMESQLESPGDYGQAEYEEITLELSLVQTGDATYAEAQAWLKEIRDGRRTALFRKDKPPEIQEGGSHPSKPAGASAAGKSKPRGSMTAAGWLPYNDVSVGSGAGGGAVASASRSRSSSKCNKGPVTLYSTSWCGVCKEARAFFRSKGVSFTDKDIEKDASAKAELDRKLPGATGVPVIDIGGDIMPGFSASSVSSKMCL